MIPQHVHFLISYLFLFLIFLFLISLRPFSAQIYSCINSNFSFTRFNVNNSQELPYILFRKELEFRLSFIRVNSKGNRIPTKRFRYFLRYRHVLIINSRFHLKEDDAISCGTLNISHVSEAIMEHKKLFVEKSILVYANSLFNYLRLKFKSSLNFLKNRFPKSSIVTTQNPI